jgi:RNA 3'-terminal phosphate cyclase
VPVRITGTVVRMRRSGPRGAGTVRLRVLAGAEVPYVRVALDEESYRTAGHAHLVGLPVRVAGRLESRGGFRRLTDASGVVPVQVDEAERDRLMKSLHENLGFFGEACAPGE